MVGRGVGGVSCERRDRPDAGMPVICKVSGPRSHFNQRAGPGTISQILRMAEAPDLLAPSSPTECLVFRGRCRIVRAPAPFTSARRSLSCRWQFSGQIGRSAVRDRSSRSRSVRRPALCRRAAPRHLRGLAPPSGTVRGGDTSTGRSRPPMGNGSVSGNRADASLRPNSLKRVADADPARGSPLGSIPISLRK